jgi:hypothetical protein
MKWLTSDEAIHIDLDVVRVYLEGDRPRWMKVPPEELFCLADG